MTDAQEGVELPTCPFCAGVAVRKPDRGVAGEVFGLVVDHKPGCFLALAGAEPDAVVDAAWNTRTTPQQPTEQQVEAEHFARVAECAFDDRPRSRVGHPSHMDWEDGYREGTRAAASAIRAAINAMQQP